AGALEVGAGDVIEDHVGLEAEEVAEPMVERHFDALFGPMELVEGAIPGVELAGVDADALTLMPVWDKASSLAIAHEVGLEPAGPPMLTGRGDEAVGDEDEGTVGERNAFGASEVMVEDLPEPELSEQGSDGEDRPPGRGIDDLRIEGVVDFVRAVAPEESLEFGEDIDEEIFAAEVGVDALLDLAVLAVGFDNADVFVDSAVGGADFDDARVHGLDYHDRLACESRSISGLVAINRNECVTTLFEPQ